MSYVRGFTPIVGAHARVLILGSAPSVASLEKHEYYGKPQNAFWRIMGELFAAGPELAYAKRAEHLAAQGVAVWDVMAECVRPGSLDSAIDMQSIVVNDFAAFFRQHPEIGQVYFNGRKAQDVYKRFVLPDVADVAPGMEYTALPSTSPAMATLNFAAKLERWRIVSQSARN